MKTLLKHLSCFCLFFIFGTNYAIAQNYQHDFDQVVKKVDDLLWYEKVGDIAHIDKVYLCGPARWKETNPTGMSAGNELKFWTYIFIPKSVDPDKKYPLIVLPHSGVHADFNTYYAHIVRELIAQEYIVVSAEYRGSTGYGKATYDNIDYGGLENEDVYVSRNYMVENFDIVDANRIGIMGWSHGGMITLMNLMTYPGKYKCGFAGVPVSDVIMRMGYSTDDYRKIFSDEGHIGKTPREDMAEYKRRSPVWHAEKLQDPLLIHTNTSDDDEELANVMIEEWATYDGDDFMENVKPNLKSILCRMKDAGDFDKVTILKPYSFVLVDEDKETVAELLLIDDDTLLVDDELLKGLDKELDEFLKNLLEK